MLNAISSMRICRRIRIISILNHKLRDSSSVAPKPFTRKSTGVIDQNKKEDELNQIEYENFLTNADECIDKFHRALLPMIPLNPSFVLSLIPGEEVKLDTGVRGSFILTIAHETLGMNLLTPISGIYQYSHDPDTGTWLSVADNHDMRGIVTRDLLRYFRGCPEF